MKGIVAQKLLPSIRDDVGRVPTVVVMIFTPTVRKLILEAEDEKLPDAIRDLVLDDRRVRNEICWFVFDC